MVTHFKQLFTFLENQWTESRLKGGFVTNLNEGVIIKLHGISILRVYYNTAKEDLHFGMLFILQ